MSYGTLYKVSYTDFFSQAAILLIKEEDYTGALTEVNAAGNPVTFTFDTPDDNLFSPINGSSLTFRLMAETDYQFINLYASDNRKYKVEFYLDAVLWWSGFILPDQYQEQYKCPPYVNEFIAADQLGFLRSVVYGLTGVTNIKQSLDYILGLTDLGLDLYEGLNIYEDNHNSTAADSPLDQTYYDNAAYTDRTCYEVLSDHLLRFGAVIKQDRGAWSIFRIQEIGEAYTRRLWTWTTLYTYTSNASYDPVVATTSAATAKASLVRIANNGSMFINPAWRSYNIVRDLGLKDNTLLNGGFDNWTGTNPDSWNIGTPVLQSYSKVLMLERYGFLASAHISQSITADRTFDQKIRISFNYTINITSGGEGTVYIELNWLNGGTTYYYDFDNENWTAVSTPRFTRHYDASVEESFEFITKEGPAYGPDDTGMVVVKIYAPNYDAGKSGITLGLKQMTILFVDATTEAEYDNTLTEPVSVNERNNYVPSDISVILADISTSIPNPKNIYRYSLYREVGLTNLTQLWSAAGGASKSLVDNMIESISEQVTNPSQVLNVTIYSKLISAGNVIQEVNNSNRLFLIKRASLDQKFGRWSVEAHQLSQTANLLLEDGNYILLETGDKIII